MTTVTPVHDLGTDDHRTKSGHDAVDPFQSLLKSVAPIVVVSDFVGATLDDYDRLIQIMGLAPGGVALPGCLFHWARSTPDGLRLCEVWRNRVLFEFFQREEAIPMYRHLQLPEPEVSCYPVHNYLNSSDLID